ncbi:hypothetical protein GP486_005391 [Trichoglossum hirsutum]|uniref:PNPLA domain-containing protein n=1 Tax=Trichoglossum hirsutum TaxID=265104 RepID=A0A9P8L970_9PEZI|nr:hypothetical protein GP486_005391 [Trichoglossum hirsutum]
MNNSTSAAPTYFKPYYHAGKSQSYIDGTLQRNNPIQTLKEERRLLWKDKSPPDIILSVGTGIQADTEGTTKLVNKRHKIAKKLVPKGLIGKIAIGLDMIQSTLDCDRQWNEFMSFTKWDCDISSVCHCLNIGLAKQPPNLDDVAAMPSLKDEVEMYLCPEETRYLDKRYVSAHEHITVVARQLTAALFYFEEDRASTKEKCTDYLRCHLSAAMMSQFENLVNAGPSFHVQTCSSLLADTISPVFDLKVFSAKITFNRPESDQWIIEIYMHHWQSWEQISRLSNLQ